MLNAGLPANEDQRLRELHALQVLNTPPEERFDRLVRLASHTFSSASAWISFFDATHQRFKAQHGITLPDLPREHSIGAHVVTNGAPLVICDVQMDPRFADSPVLESRPEICFYAAAPPAGQQYLRRSACSQRLSSPAFCIGSATPAGGTRPSGRRRTDRPA